MITVPHATAPVPEPEGSHLWDKAAPEFAGLVVDRLRRYSFFETQLVEGDISRTVMDLNRDESIGSEWRSILSEEIPHAMILLDLHSFPPYSEKYGDSDATLLVNPTAMEEKNYFSAVYSLVLNFELISPEFKVNVLKPMPGENSIVEEYWLNGPVRGVGFLMEVNERLDRAELEDMARIVARWVVKMHEEAEA